MGHQEEKESPWCKSVVKQKQHPQVSLAQSLMALPRLARGGQDPAQLAHTWHRAVVIGMGIDSHRHTSESWLCFNQLHKLSPII